MDYSSQLYYLLPLLVVVLGGVVLLLLEAFARRGGRWLMHLATVTCAIALFGAWLVGRKVGALGPQTLFDGMLVVDKFSIFLTVLFVASALLVGLLSADFMREHGVLYGEYYPLLLFGTAGMIILAAANDLVTIFLGIETMSLAAYVLTGSLRRQRRSSEAAMKYFITGAFATGFLVYGIALVYGMVGSTNLPEIQRATAAHVQPVFVFGVFMLIVAMAFKVSAVPFHMWAPDAYEGAPTPVTGFMAAGIKAAAFTAVMRLFWTGLGGDILPFGHFGWASIFIVLSVLTMTVANLAALRQENVKRMLAYSSVAHAGYLLIGVVAAGISGSKGDVARSAMLFYLLAYTFTTIGAFGVVAWIGRRNDERSLVDDWNGLAARHPAAALAMTIFLLSLAGMPPTAGFFGKFYVFRAAMEPDGQLLWLVVVAVVNSVISVFYYLRLVVAMYFRDPARPHTPLQSPSSVIALAICALFVLGMGLLPGSWLGLAETSTIAGLFGR